MAMLSSATACAPITAHNAIGSVSNLAAFSTSQTDGAASPVVAAASGSSTAATAATAVSSGSENRHHGGLAERLHGLTERLGSLGHSRTESDVSNRTRTGSASSFFAASSRGCRWLPLAIDG